jgi:hypothetical protein
LFSGVRRVRGYPGRCSSILERTPMRWKSGPLFRWSPRKPGPSRRTQEAEQLFSGFPLSPAYSGGMSGRCLWIELNAIRSCCRHRLGLSDVASMFSAVSRSPEFCLTSASATGDDKQNSSVTEFP